MGKKSTHELIVDVIKDKSILKQDIYQNTVAAFQELKSNLKKIVENLQKEFSHMDGRITFHYKEKSELEAEIKIAGDILVFHMHTNVFKFELTDSVWKTSYLKNDERNGYVGSINIYNFLSDSIKYHRSNDIGYLVARVFINRENKFMVQGKRQLGLLYSSFEDAVIDEKAICDIIDSIILYTLSFDLYTPPYNRVQEVTVGEVVAESQDIKTVTGKRVGFKFSSDSK